MSALLLITEEYGLTQLLSKLSRLTPTETLIDVTCLPYLFD